MLVSKTEDVSSILAGPANKIFIMKVVNNYKDYIVACEEVEKTGDYIWMPKVSYELLSKEDIKNLLFSNENLDSTLKMILSDVFNNHGKKYSRGILIGVELTNEDYYYVYDCNGRKTYDTCVNNLF